jgi:transposase
MTYEERNKKIFEMRAAGVPNKKIAEELGCRRTSIYNLVSRTRREGGEKKQAAPRQPKKVLTAPIELSENKGQLKAIVLSGGLEDVLEAIRRI